MKKIVKLLFAGVLMSALCVGVVACDKSAPPGIDPDPAADCWVFVNATPGEETILLAKSGLSWGEGHAIFDDFESEYGKGNVLMSIDYPGGINNFELDSFEIESDALTNCYEITMTIDFRDIAPPSIETLIFHGFRGGVKFDGSIATCKQYLWAYTEEGADITRQYYEKSYGSPGYSIDYDGYYWVSGTIVASTIKNLGPEIHNEPVIF